MVAFLKNKSKNQTITFTIKKILCSLTTIFAVNVFQVALLLFIVEVFTLKEISNVLMFSADILWEVENNVPNSSSLGYRRRIIWALMLMVHMHVIF